MSRGQGLVNFQSASAFPKNFLKKVKNLLTNLLKCAIIKAQGTPTIERGTSL